MYARRARRARVARRPPRTAPSLSTERRPKRRRETRTTTGDGMREEDEERTTAACASASPRPARSPWRRAKAARRVCAPAPAERRTTSTNKCRGSERRVSGEAMRGTFDRSKTKRGRARCSTRVLEQQQTITRARPGTLIEGVQKGSLGGFEGNRGGVWAPSWPVEGLRTCCRLPSARSRSGERRPR